MVFSASLSYRSLWTPEHISTALWLDAADSSTITTVSGAVSQWNDKSGNGRNATQSTVSLRPTYNATGFNNKGVVEFNANTYRRLEVSFLPLQDKATILAVCENDTQDSNESIWKPFFVASQNVFVSNPQGYSLSKLRANSAGLGGMFPSSGGAETFLRFNYAPSPGSYEIVGLTNNQCNPYTLRRNGTEVSTDTNTNRTSGWFTTYWIGAESTYTRFYTGNLTEIVVLTSTPDLNVTQKIEGYLAHKWGLTANLPSSHLYKNNPPRGL